MLKAVLRVVKSRVLESKRKGMEQSFQYFQSLSELGGIRSILFEQGRSILTLGDGRRYWFDPLSGDASGLFSLPVTGQFEQKETETVRKLVGSEDVCVDVGANFGYYTVLMAQKGREVHAFEPLEGTYQILSDNLKLNVCNNVVTNELALDKAKGKKDIFLPDIGISGSFKLHRYKKSFKKFTIETTSLDEYVSEHSLIRVDFLKADIEGAELLMLKGAKAVLADFQPIVFLEVQESSTELFDYSPKDLFEFLKKFGYDAFFVEKGKLKEVKSLDALPDYNFFFLPQSKRAKIEEDFLSAK